MSKTEKPAKRGATESVRPSPEFIHIQASRGAVLWVCAGFSVAILCVAAGAFWLGTRTAHANAPAQSKTQLAQSTPPPGEQGDTFRTESGPWGELECTRAEIELPDEYLSTRIHQTDMSQWLFKGYSANNVSNLFAEAGLSPKEKADLLDSTRWRLVPGGISITPSQETVLSLSPTARGRIYEVLGRFGENAAQDQAFRWPADSLETIFAGAELSAETRALVNRLCYRRGKLVLFADLAAVLRTLPSEAEKTHLEKTLSRRPTLLARLVISPDSDVDALMRYWGRPGAAKDFRPLLEAAARVPEGTKLSILNLLPAWPATRLNSFPLPAPGAQFDCFWTAFNFFKDPPGAPTTDARLWKEKLDAEYYRVTSDPRYGDLVMLTRPDGTIIHACVFLADEIVFSKNGAVASAPWVLTTIPELVTDYSAELPANESLHVVYYRSRNG